LEVLNNILLGFNVATTGWNLFYCFLGTLVGTLVGMLPGLGPMGAMAVLLPFMYSLGDPISSLIFLAGIYYGAQYGGSTMAVLLNIPGEPSSIVTTIDGYQMAKQGKAGQALAVAALSSFFAGTVATLLIALLAVPLAEVAFIFGPAEYASLMLLGFLASAALAQGDFLKSLAMILIGILVGTIGIDINTGVERFTFSVFELSDGISFILVAMGIFGIGEILYDWFHNSYNTSTIPKVEKLYPSKKDLRQSIAPTLRGTAIGSIMGLIPGAGTILSSFASYVIEKKVSRNKENLGKGAIEGIAGPEAANNAGAQTGFIPMLSLGFPVTVTMSLMLAALIINGIRPGPSVITDHPNLFWGLIASMWIGNLMLVILNLPLIGIWVKILSIPRKILYGLVIVTCLIGAYYIGNNWFGVWTLIALSIIGYMFRRLGCEVAPLAMGLVIGTMFEENFRRALTLSQGSFMIFIESPISLSFILATVILLIVNYYMRMKKIK
jgi:putative tricarboxylic transport membrane protein